MKVVAIEFSGKGAMLHYVFHLSRALQRAGVDMTLVTSVTYELEHLENNFRVVKLLNLWDPHVNPIRNEVLRRTRRVFRGLRFIGAWFQVMNFVRKEKPDVVMIGIIRFAFEYFFLLLLKLMGVPLVEVVHDVHTFDHRPGKPILKESKSHLWQYSKIYGLFDALFVHDKTNYNEFLKLYPTIKPERVHQIPLPASDMVLEMTPDRTPDQLRKEFNVAPGQQVVMFFGTLNKYKGVEVLLEAFPEIHKATGARLVVAGYAGKDTDPDALRAIVEEGGVAEHVSWFLEYFPNERVVPLMQVGDVIAYPYRLITQSGALKIAFACGKPVVATRVGGLPDVVEDGKNGYLVPPEDAHALAEAVIKILKDPEHAAEMGRYAKELSETRFSWRIVAETMKGVFEQLVGTKTRKPTRSEATETETKVITERA